MDSMDQPAAGAPTAADLSRRGLLGRGAAAGTAAALGGSVLTACSASAGDGADGDDPNRASGGPGTPDRAEPYSGTELVTLGVCAGPPPESGRNGIASALHVRGRNYVVDCGRGALTQYYEAGLRLDALANIFITHLHADHLADYYNFFMLGGWGPSDTEDNVHQRVTVHGPGPAGGLPEPSRGGNPSTVAPENPTPGLAELTRRCVQAFAYSHNVFMRDSGIPDVRDLVQVREIPVPAVGASPHGPTAPDMAPFPVMADDRVRVSAILVPHGPVFPAFALRFDTPDGSVVFSGDTSRSPNVVRLARGADVLVHEVLDPDWYRSNGTSPVKLDHLLQSHTSATEVGAVAQEAGAKTLVLSHYAPSAVGTVTPQRWREQAQRGYQGRVIVGEDLLRLRLR